MQTSGVYPKCAGQAQRSKETPEPGDQPHHVPCSSGSATHTDDNEETILTSMKFNFLQFAKFANDKVGGIRLPADFHTAVHHSGLECRTENQRSSAKVDLIEWSGPIPM